jgi:hypothetical protein
MKNIATALVKAQKEFGPALKSSTNPHFRSKYADLAACVEAVIDGLNNNGIFLIQVTEERSTGVCVETQFVHESGEIMSGGSLFMPASKIDAQGFGSALTYARRYSLMAACGLAPEDDDANLASSRPTVAAPKPVAKPVVQEVKAIAAPVVQEVPAVPPKMDGKLGEWQLKTSTQPDTDFDSWVSVVMDTTRFLLDTTTSSADVMAIFRNNRIIYDRIQTDKKDSYEDLMSLFKQHKEKFNVQQ